MEVTHEVVYIGNRIATYLKNSDYDIKLTNDYGLRKEIPSCLMTSFGILKNDMVRTRWLKRRSRRTFIGVLWIDNKFRNANTDNMLFELHHPDTRELAEHICQSIMDKFGVKIRLHILNPETCEKYESWDSDYDM